MHNPPTAEKATSPHSVSKPALASRLSLGTHHPALGIWLSTQPSRSAAGHAEQLGGVEFAGLLLDFGEDRLVDAFGGGGLFFEDALEIDCGEFPAAGVVLLSDLAQGVGSAESESDAGAFGGDGFEGAAESFSQEATHATFDDAAQELAGETFDDL